MMNEMRGAWCQMCGPGRSSCYTRCYLENGVWKRVEGCPDAANNGLFGSVSLCAKGNAAPASLHASPRLLHPMRRVGPKGPGARFERISWDEALDQISSTLLMQKREFGSESFGILSPQFYAVTAGVGRRFLNVHGSPNYLHSGICHEQRTVAAATVLGPGLGRPGFGANTIPAQLDKTELLVSWAANPENASVNLGALRERVDAQARGMKVVEIRPLCDSLVSKADVWLPIRPGTDLALALGFLHVICGEGLYDRDFTEQWCHGFEQLAEHVRQYTPEWAARHCGIPAQKIREVARMIAAARPCGIVFGNGVGDQCRDGYWTVVAIQLIGAICGNIGKPGGGADWVPLAPLVPFRPFPDTLAQRLPRSEEDEANGWRAGTSKLVAPEFPKWHQGIANHEPTSSYLRGLTSVLTQDPYPLRGVFAQCTNPLSATRDSKLVAEALEKIDFYFAMDQHWNPSCDYADIVLPAASFYECSHQIGMKNFAEGTFLAMSQQVADPPGEAMSDLEFYLKLACRMGYAEDFWNGDVETLLASMVAPTGYTLEQLRSAPEGIFIPRQGVAEADGRADALPIPASDRGDADQAEGSELKPSAHLVHSDTADEPEPASEPMPDYERLFAQLPHGKVQCVNEIVGGKPSLDGGVLASLPVYQGPAEGIAETPELARDYPYAFSDVHAHRLSQHSYFNDIAQLRRFADRPWVKMHPETAARHGIADGDWVDVESPHGRCVLQANVTEGVAPDVLMGRRGWWQPCPDLGQPGYSWEDGGAEVNVLYAGDFQHSDPFVTAHGKQTLVRIRKHEGSGPKVFEASSLEGERGVRASAGEASLDGVSGVRFDFDPMRCVKCHACEVACAMWHDGAGHRFVEEVESGKYPDVTREFRSVAQRGCDLCAGSGGNPRCALTCPTGALTVRN